MKGKLGFFEGKHIDESGEPADHSLPVDNVVMPSTVQIFQIVRAPEEPPLSAKEIRGLLWRHRPNSEWEVIEGA